jgi:hypothetical protein
LVSVTVRYAEAGTAASESFWSVSVSMPVDCTGLLKNTRPVAVDDAAEVAVAPAPAPAMASAATAARDPARRTRGDVST